MSVHIMSLFILLFCFELGYSQKNEIELLTYKLFRIILNETLFNLKQDIEQSCFDHLFENYISEKNSYFYFDKLIHTSSHSNNDLGSHNDCTKVDTLYCESNSSCESQLSNLTYILVKVESQKREFNVTDLRYDPILNTNLNGYCFSKGCSEKDYSLIFEDINPKFYSDFDSETSVISVYMTDNNHSDDGCYKYDREFFISLIPLYLMLVIILFSVFPGLTKILKCFFKNSNANSKSSLNTVANLSPSEQSRLRELRSFLVRSTTSNSGINNTNSTILNESRYNEGLFHEFVSCFNISKNFFYLNNKQETDNDIGLTHVRAILAFGFVFLVFAHCYYILLTNPLNILTKEEYKELIIGPFYAIIMYSRTHSFRLLYAISGYTLVYKLISYLKNKCQKVSQLASMNYLTQNRIIQDDLLNNQQPITTESLDRITCLFNENRDEINHSDLSNKFLFRFIFLQFYKYFAFVLIMFFYKFSFSNFVRIFTPNNPMWYVYLREVLSKFSLSDLIETIFLIPTFYPAKNYEYNYFRLCLCEISNFVIFTPIIFFGFKRKWRLDLLFILMTVSCISLKLVVYIIVPESTPSVLLPKNKFAPFYRIPLTNFSHFLIGCFFGLINYCWQFSISENTVKEHNYRYFIIPVKFNNYFIKDSIVNKAKIFLFSTIATVICILLLLNWFIIYKIMNYPENDYLAEFFNLKIVNFICLVDTELFLFAFLLIIQMNVMFGENALKNFLSKRIFKFYSFNYFLLLLIQCPLILYFNYQSESKIKIDKFNLIFITIFLIIFIRLIAHVLCYYFMLPLKKLNELIMKEEQYENI